MDDQITVLDRLASAFVSDDLSQSALRRTDADYLGGLGFAGRKYPIASSLIRFYLSGDTAAMREAKERTLLIVKKVAARQNVGLRAREALEVAGAALRYAVDPVCPTCHGTKYQLIPGTRVLGKNVCRTCRGDGRRPLPLRHRKLIVLVVGHIQKIESILIDAVRGQL